MILLAKPFAGRLDISAPETLGSPTVTIFRRTVRTGDVLTVPDEYRQFPNIRNAITAGLLEVISHDSAPESLVINAELAGGSSSGVPGTKFILLDIHGGLDTEELNEDNGTPFFPFGPGDRSSTTWSLAVPDDYAALTPIYVEVYWTASHTESGNVRWVLEYKSVPSGSPVGLPATSAPFVQAAPAAGLLVTTGVSLVVPSSTANHLLTIIVSRDGGHAADTFGRQARVHLVRLRYTGKVFTS